MFKLILLLLLLGFACVAVMMLIQRLNSIASQLGDLRRQVDRKDAELSRRVASLNEQAQANQEQGGRTRIEK